MPAQAAKQKVELAAQLQNVSLAAADLGKQKQQLEARLVAASDLAQQVWTAAASPAGPLAMPLRAPAHCTTRPWLCLTDWRAARCETATDIAPCSLHLPHLPHSTMPSCRSMSS